MPRPRRRRGRNTLATTVVVALAATLLALNPASPPAASASPPPAVAADQAISLPNAVTSPARPKPVTQEVPALRRANARTFHQADGTYRTDVYQGAVNYRDAKGAWQPIDNTLTPTTEPGFKLTNRAGPYRASLPDTLAKPVKVATADGWVSFTLAGASGQEASSGATATYPDALRGVDVAYQPVNQGLKETLTLADRTAPSVFTYHLDHAAGLTAQLSTTAKGAVELIDAKGKVAFTIPAAFAYDQAYKTAGNLDGYTDQVTTTLAPAAGDGETFTLTVDPAWLADPARQFPVVVDPIVTTVQNRDCHIVSGAKATTSFCGTSPMEVGYYTTDAWKRRALLRFDVEGAMSPDPTVLDASLRLYAQAHTVGTSSTIEVHGVNADRPFSNGATWNNYDSAHAWTTPGGDYGSLIDTTTVTGAGYYNWNVTDRAQRWARGEFVDNGLLLKRDSEAVSDIVQFASMEATDSSRWPSLSVSWVPSLGDRRGYRLESQKLSDRSDLAVNIANGNTILSATDLQINGTGLGLGVKRTYNGLADSYVRASAGNRWSVAPGDITLFINPNGVHQLTGPSGWRLPFNPKSGGGWTSPSGIDADLTYDSPSGNYTVKFQKSRQSWIFHKKISGDNNAYLDKITDRNGNHIDLTWDTSTTPARVSKITDTQSRDVTFTYTGSTSTLIDKITDSTGRYVDYTYDGSGNLIAVRDTDGKTVQYAYTGNALTKVTDARGNDTVLTYDSVDHIYAQSITRVTNPGAGTGPTTSFSFQPWQNLSASDGTDSLGTTWVYDPRGKKTTYEYDAHDRVTKTVDQLGHTRKGTYTSDDNVATSTDALSSQSTNSYDSNNRLTGTAQANASGGGAGSTTSFDYDTTAGNEGSPSYYSPTGSTDSMGHNTTYGYDPVTGNQKTSSESTSGVTVTKNYNSDGTVKDMTDGKGNTTSYSYTGGNLTKTTPPSGSGLGIITRTVDPLSRTKTETDGRGTTKTYTYDGDDRVTSIVYTNGASSTTIGWTYDANGNVTQVTDPTGTTTFTYDPLNRNTGKASPGRTAITYDYDLNSNLETLTDAGGTVSYYYDDANRPSSVIEPGNRVTTFGYDDADRRTRISFPNDVTETMTYDKAGRHLTAKAQKGAGSGSPTDLVDLRYCYRDPTAPISTDTAPCDPTSNTNADRDTRQKVTDAISGRTTCYAYDGLGRLVNSKAIVGSFPSYTWAYDKASNRTKQVIGTNVTWYGYNSGNELCWTQAGGSDPGSACTAPSGSTTFNYDSNGNQTAASDGFAASYNNLDQATSITGGPSSGGSGTLGSMSYAGADQAQRVQTGASLYTTNTLGLSVEAPSGGGTATFYTRDNGGNLLAQRTPTGTQYLILDALGSVVAVTDGVSGAVLGRYSYNAFGAVTFTGTVGSKFQYASGYTDSQTGLIKFGIRYYNVVLGRWTQQDPSDLEDGYAYAGNDPVNHTDPSGAFSKADAASVVGGWVGGSITQIGLTAIGCAVSAGIGCAVAGVVFGAAAGGALAATGSALMGGTAEENKSAALGGMLGGALGGLGNGVVGRLGEKAYKFTH